MPTFQIKQITADQGNLYCLTHNDEVFYWCPHTIKWHKYPDLIKENIYVSEINNTVTITEPISTPPG